LGPAEGKMPYISPFVTPIFGLPGTPPPNPGGPPLGGCRPDLPPPQGPKKRPWRGQGFLSRCLSGPPPLSSPRTRRLRGRGGGTGTGMKGPVSGPPNAAPRPITRPPRGSKGHGKPPPPNNGSPGHLFGPRLRTPEVAHYSDPVPC